MKLKRLILIFGALFVSSLTLASCGNEDNLPSTTTETSCETHSYGAWTVTKKPTETEKGKATRSCKNCSSVEEKELPVITSDNYEIDVKTETSCSAKGKNKYTLKEDRNIFFEAEVATLAHEGGIFCNECGESLVEDAFWDNMVNVANYNQISATISELKLNNKTYNNLSAQITNGEKLEAFGQYETTENNVTSTYYFKYEEGSLYTGIKTGDTIYYSYSNSLTNEMINPLIKYVDQKTNSALFNKDTLKTNLWKIADSQKNGDKYIIKPSKEKITALNEDLTTKSIKELANVNVSQLEFIINLLDKTTITGFLDSASTLGISINDIVTPLDTLLANLSIFSNTIPGSTAQLVRDYLVKNNRVAEDEIASFTSIIEMLKYLDPSTETNKVMGTDFLVDLLGIDKNGKTSKEALTAKLDELLGLTVYDLIPKVVTFIPLSSNALKALVTSYIDSMGTKYNPEIVVSSTGIIESVTVKSGNETIMEVKNNNTITRDFTVETEIKALNAKLTQSVKNDIITNIKSNLATNAPKFGTQATNEGTWEENTLVSNEAFDENNTKSRITYDLSNVFNSYSFVKDGNTYQMSFDIPFDTNVPDYVEELQKAQIEIVIN